MSGGSQRLLVVFIVLLLAIAGAIFGVRYLQRKQRIEESVRTAPQRMLDFTANLPTAYFVSIDGDTLTFSWPEQVNHESVNYVEQVQHMGTITDPDVVRAVGGAIPYSELKPGDKLRLDMIPDTSNSLNYIINVAYLIE